MLGLIFIYWLGKFYYLLAEKHDKHKWGFAILGVATYYAGTFIAGILLGFVIFFFNGEDTFDNMSDTALSLMALPFGLLATWGLYQYLKKRWARTTLPTTNAEILDDLTNL